MRYTAGINSKTLKMNVGELFRSYDTNGDGFSSKELKSMVKDSVSVFAKPFITDKNIQKVSDKLDTNKDGIISKEEMSGYLKENYGLTYEQATSMTVKDLANLINDKEDQKKKDKKQQLFD